MDCPGQLELLPHAETVSADGGGKWNILQLLFLTLKIRPLVFETENCPNFSATPLTLTVLLMIEFL